MNAVIDRTFVADGIRWVVDFKTSPHEGGDREAFLDSEVVRYTPQLTRYVHLARQLGSAAGARGAVFPAAGRVARSRCRCSKTPSNENALRPEASGVAPSVISRTSRSASAVRPVMSPCDDIVAGGVRVMRSLDREGSAEIAQLADSRAIGRELPSKTAW